MKIKLFKRELVADGYFSKTRLETNEELESLLLTYRYSSTSNLGKLLIKSTVCIDTLIILSSKLKIYFSFSL